MLTDEAKGLNGCADGSSWFIWWIWTTWSLQSTDSSSSAFWLTDFCGTISELVEADIKLHEGSDKLEETFAEEEDIMGSDKFDIVLAEEETKGANKSEVIMSGGRPGMSTSKLS